MDTTRLVEDVLLVVCRELLRLAERELKRFSDALEDWVNQLLTRRLPADWRERLHAYLDAWDSEFGVSAEDRPILERWIEGWARLLGLLPDEANSATPSQSAAEFLESQFAEQVFSSYFDGLHVRSIHPRMDRREPRVTSARPLRGLGAWYDDARQRGYQPWRHTRVAISIARTLLPDSEPSMVITYSDGQTLIVMGGGPSSGALAGQAASITGLGAAINRASCSPNWARTLPTRPSRKSPARQWAHRQSHRGSLSHQDPN